MDPDDGLSWKRCHICAITTDPNQKGANLGGNERQLLRLEINQRESNEGKFGTLSKCGISVYSQKYNKQHI